MTSFIEFDIQKPHFITSQRYEFRWGYMVFDAASGGPIEWGEANTKEEAVNKARTRRDWWEKYFEEEEKYA